MATKFNWVYKSTSCIKLYRYSVLKLFSHTTLAPLTPGDQSYKFQNKVNVLLMNIPIRHNTMLSNQENIHKYRDIQCIVSKRMFNPDEQVFHNMFPTMHASSMSKNKVEVSNWFM